jgi:glycosyltransferase involved in cell wall biosynthesis
MSNFPLVSIIINNYNYDRYVRMAIESALHQSWQNVEVIVVDDGSTDKSREIIQKYEHKARIILKENGGQGSAFNAGFAESKGEIILFLDADDMLLHETCGKRSCGHLQKILFPKYIGTCGSLMNMEILQIK